MKEEIKTLLIGLLLLFGTHRICLAQTDSLKTPQKETPTRSIDPPPPQEKIVSDRYGFLSELEFTLSISVLVFGALIIFLEVYLIKIKKIGHEYIAKIILVTLIVTGTLFLITAGYDNNQIAPATGLLGTIAGYLLGKTSAPEKTSKTPNDEE